VVITGGSRGLGLELARAFGERGARVAISARSKEELERALDDLHSRGAQAYAFVCDLTDREATREFIAAASQRLGGIDILINNAGRIEVGPYETMTEEDFQNEMQLHLYAPLWAIQASLPSLRERRGRIVNISSIGGLISVPHLLPYSVSKFALVGLSEGLRAELVREGVSVITVCPGLMRTGSTENAHFKSQNQKEYAWFAASDATAITSISARSAALRILKAVEHCEPFVVISAQAKLLALVHALFPNFTAFALSLAAAILPKSGGIGSDRVTGKESHSRLLPTVLLTSLERTAKEQNQLV
jgi:NAD(P)-dependent dehydrogenase (short-subunit alcohol dehydrogenase family)